MNRKERSEPKWTVDDPVQLERDAELANEFGIQDLEITAARQILETFSWAFHSNALEIYEQSKKSINSMIDHLVKIQGRLHEVNIDINSSMLGNAIEDIAKSIKTLQNISTRLPQRSRSIQLTCAVFLTSVYMYANGRNGKEMHREIKNSFNGETPIHPSMKFVMIMLERSNDALVRSTSISTVKRARREFIETKPKPNEVYAFEGDPSFLAE